MERPGPDRLRKRLALLAVPALLGTSDEHSAVFYLHDLGIEELNDRGKGARNGYQVAHVPAPAVPPLVLVGKEVEFAHQGRRGTQLCTAELDARSSEAEGLDQQFNTCDFVQL